MNDLQRAQACAEKMMAGDNASRALGIGVEITTVGQATATMRVREDMVNGFNICHGGLVFTLADTAFAFACNAYDDLSVAGSGHIEFLLPANLNDVLTASAREEKRSGRNGFYTIDVNNQEGALIALFRGRSVSRGKRILGDKNDT
jgi:acyl-CoA thioesterase